MAIFFPLPVSRYYNLKEYEKAYNYIETALELIIQKGDKENEIRAYTILGDINYFSEQYDLSTENYFKAISLAEKISKNQLSYNSRKNLGVAFKANNDFDKAVFYFNSFLTHTAKNLSNNDIVFTKLHLAETYELKGEQSLAEQTYKEVLSIE